MSSFSNSLIEKHLGQVEVVYPRPVALYESSPGAVGDTIIDGQHVFTNGTEGEVFDENQRQKRETALGSEIGENSVLYHESYFQTIQTNFLPGEKEADIHQEPPEVPPVIRSFDLRQTSREDEKKHQERKKDGSAPDQLVRPRITLGQEEQRVDAAAPAPPIDFIRPRDMVTASSPPVIPSPEQGATHAQASVDVTPSAPIVKVSIGRIEVKAVFSKPSTSRKSGTAYQPRLSLEDYLKKQGKTNK